MENNNLIGNIAPEGATPQTQNEQLIKLQNALLECESLSSAYLKSIHYQMEKAGVKPRFKKGSELSELKEKMLNSLREWCDDNEHDFDEKISEAVETRLAYNENHNEQGARIEIEKETKGTWQVGFDIAENFVNDFFYRLEQEGGAK